MNELFPRASCSSQKDRGWTIDTTYIQRLKEAVELDPCGDEFPSWEEAEAVLLAVEKVGLK